MLDLIIVIKKNYEIIITLDADGQHDPAYISKFLKYIDEGADIVLGLRNESQRFSEKVFSTLLNYLYGISDPLCGFKVYKNKLYLLKGQFDSYNSIGTELLLFAIKNRLKIPMKNNMRSLNIASSVAIILAESLKQTKLI